MTLVLSIQGRDTLWVVADRRVSYDDGRPPYDEAVKVMQLSANDGVGVLAYAGLGDTASCTQPSDWMRKVLRGRAELSFEQMLGVLADAATRELPSHLFARTSAKRPVEGHFIIAPAFIHGVGPRFFSIDNIIDSRTGTHAFRFMKWQRTAAPNSGVRIAFAGSGGYYLSKLKGPWRRDLQSLVKENDRGRVPDELIADQLAALNCRAHQRMRTKSVGPRCIVVWCRRRDMKRDVSGGGHLFYTGESRDKTSEALPNVGSGLDIKAIFDGMKDYTMKHPGQRPEPGQRHSPPPLFRPGAVAEIISSARNAPDEKLR